MTQRKEERRYWYNPSPNRENVGQCPVRTSKGDRCKLKAWCDGVCCRFHTPPEDIITKDIRLTESGPVKRKHHPQRWEATSGTSRDYTEPAGAVNKSVMERLRDPTKMHWDGHFMRRTGKRPDSRLYDENFYRNKKAEWQRLYGELISATKPRPKPAESPKIQRAAPSELEIEAEEQAEIGGGEEVGLGEPAVPQKKRKPRRKVHRVGKRKARGKAKKGKEIEIEKEEPSTSLIPPKKKKKKKVGVESEIRVEVKNMIDNEELEILKYNAKHIPIACKIKKSKRVDFDFIYLTPQELDYATKK